LFFNSKKIQKQSTTAEAEKILVTFAQSIKENIMSKINMHLTDMKEVLRNSVSQIIMEELNLQSLGDIDQSELGKYKLVDLKKRINAKIDAIIVQQIVSAMERISLEK
jgi:hypothetical protein